MHRAEQWQSRQRKPECRDVGEEGIGYKGKGRVCEVEQMMGYRESAVLRGSKGEEEEKSQCT